MLENPFTEILAQTIWGARLGIGSFFFLEFGPREASEDGHGRYSLWVQHSSWRICSDQDWIGSDNERDEIVPWLDGLNGQVVDRIECGAYGDLTIALENGFQISTFASYKSMAGDPWVFYKPMEIVVGLPRRDVSWSVERRT
jgi:hypothetical protein